MSTLTKPSVRYHEYVQPQCEEFLNDPFARWKADNAAKALNEHLEWTYKYVQQHDPSRLPGDGSITEFREEVFSHCPEARTMWDLADAAKHRFLTRNAAVRIVRSSSDAYDEEEDGLAVPGYDVNMSNVVRRGMTYWENWED